MYSNSVERIWHFFGLYCNRSNYLPPWEDDRHQLSENKCVLLNTVTFYFVFILFRNGRISFWPGTQKNTEASSESELIPSWFGFPISFFIIGKRTLRKTYFGVLWCSGNTVNTRLTCKVVLRAVRALSPTGPHWLLPVKNQLGDMVIEFLRNTYFNWKTNKHKKNACIIIKKKDPYSDFRNFSIFKAFFATFKGEVSRKFAVISKPKSVCLSAETKK